jgi:SAM-dependent methyltransferase
MAKLLKLENILEILVDPQTKDPLLLNGDHLININNNQNFPIINQSRCPLLFPSNIIPYCKNNSLDWVDLIESKDSLKQYFGLAYIKWNGGCHNSCSDDDHYQNYLRNFKHLISDAKGIVLDIGCDDPSNTIKYFPSSVSYIGCDPLYYVSSGYFKIHSVCEFLPFKGGVFDSICFGTSLDHVFDVYLALSEAVRVLKVGGNFYLSTLVWLKSA